MVDQYGIIGIIFSSSLTLLALLPAVIGILLTIYIGKRRDGIGENYLKTEIFLISFITIVLVAVSLLGIFSLLFLISYPILPFHFLICLLIFIMVAVAITISVGVYRTLTTMRYL
jgi:hypothetical protein